MKILHVSSLAIGYLEITDAPEVEPGTEMIVITGDICTHPKRTLHYVEEAALAHPDIPVVFNMGVLEYEYRIAPKYIAASTHFRYNVAKAAPSNAHYANTPKIINGVAALSIYGWPRLTKEAFKASKLSKTVYSEFFTDFYIDDFLCTKNFPQHLLYDEYVGIVEYEEAQLAELAKIDGPKLVVCALPKSSSPWIGGSYEPVAMPDGALVVYATDDPFIGTINL
jgi:hypothetical protein